jgi:hypothetical protein
MSKFAVTPRFEVGGIFQRIGAGKLREEVDLSLYRVGDYVKLRKRKE